MNKDTDKSIFRNYFGKKWDKTVELIIEYLDSGKQEISNDEKRDLLAARCECYMNLKKSDEAKKDLDEAISLGLDISTDKKLLEIYHFLNVRDKLKACVQALENASIQSNMNCGRELAFLQRIDPNGFSFKNETPRERSRSHDRLRKA